MSGETKGRPEDESIAFSWRGLPQYGARLLAGAFDELGATFPVVASRPSAPIEGMEEHLGGTIHWVDGKVPTSWAKLGRPVPKVFFQSGWSHAAFSALGDEVLASGGQICLAFDNDWRGSFGQRLRGPAFRLRARKRYAAVLVPGVSGRQLALAMGFPPGRIWTGSYGADDALFNGGLPLAARPPIILYVGQYIERKRCVPFAQAFAAVSDEIPSWELHMYGDGPLRSQIPSHPQIKVSGFTQPEELADLYRNARVLALPSSRESWGLVVHEACLSGCQLLLSDKIGSAADFATPTNSRMFDPEETSEMERAILDIARRTPAELQLASDASREVAQTHGPRTFGRSVAEIRNALLVTHSVAL